MSIGNVAKFIPSHKLFYFVWEPNSSVLQIFYFDTTFMKHFKQWPQVIFLFFYYLTGLNLSSSGFIAIPDVLP